jgi:glycolate oxidase FAD binding subunit
MGECGGATIRWTVSCSEIGEFRSALDLARKAGSSLSATFVVESAPAHAKRTLDVWGAAPAGLEIMKRLKARFDPLGIFAPGRFVGGI